MRIDVSVLHKCSLGALASLLTAVLFIAFCSDAARAVNLNVEIDQSTLIKLDKPGTEIIVGNPAIADVTVQSRKLLVVTGKSAGLTNLLVLDGAGSLIYNKKVFVSSDKDRLVTVSKGVSRETYSCSPQCDPSLTPGDAATYFDPLAKEIRDKIGLTQSALDGTTAQQ